MKPHLITIMTSNGTNFHFTNNTNPIYSAFSAISAIDKTSDVAEPLQITHHLAERLKHQQVRDENIYNRAFASESVINLQRGMFSIEYDHDTYALREELCPSNFQMPISDMGDVYTEALLESADEMNAKVPQEPADIISDTILDILVQLFDQEPDLDGSKMQTLEM